MIALLIIFSVTGLSVYISCNYSPDVTYFDYYRGGIIGLLVSSFIIFLWNKRQKKNEPKVDRRYDIM